MPTEPSAKLFQPGARRPITEIAPYQGNTDRTLTIMVRLRDAELCTRLLTRLRGRAGKARLTALLREELSATVEVRDRAGLMQPQIPGRLKAELHEMSGTAGLRRANKLVREELARWIDFATGMRKRRKLKGNARRHVTRRPKQSAEFRQRGQALVQEPGQVKFAFNAGSKQNKGAVARLMKGLDMNMSEFFSALVERIVRQPGSASLASHSNDPRPDVRLR